jgi:solute carrier family 25, member 34/35
MEAFICGGGAALVAITCTHPIDVVKTRLQVQGELGANDRAYRGIVSSLGTIARREGTRGLYRGLLPAYGLQFSVTAVRFAVYDVQKRLIGEEFGKGATQGEQSTLRNFAMGCISGVWGGVCGNPWFLVKSQFQSYSTDPTLASVGTQHKHAGVVSAFAKIGREQGIFGYWRGLTAFLPRVCIYSGVQVATYDGVKELALTTGGLGDNFSTRLVCSTVTTFTAVTALQPFDFLSVRLMNQKVDPHGRPAQYKNAFDCAAQTARAEGVAGFFKGGLTNYARFAPYGILQLVLIEQFKELMSRFKTREAT